MTRREQPSALRRHRSDDFLGGGLTNRQGMCLDTIVFIFQRRFNGFFYFFGGKRDLITFILSSTRREIKGDRVRGEFNFLRNKFCKKKRKFDCVFLRMLLGSINPGSYKYLLLITGNNICISLKSYTKRGKHGKLYTLMLVEKNIVKSLRVLQTIQL